MAQASHNPFISVVIPTYGRLARLQSAVHSILEQSFSDWELIVSDDETPAGETWKWLQDIAARDHRICPVQNLQGQGQAKNTNFAMAQARGEWIKILHDDDCCLPGALEILAAAAEQADKGVVLITTRVRKNEHKLSSLLRQCFSKFPRRWGQSLPNNKDGGLCSHVTSTRGSSMRQGIVPAAPLVRYPGNEVIYRLYMQEESGGTIPSSMLIRADCVRGGVQFEKLADLPNIVDAWFKVLLMEHGDLLHVDRFCVIKSNADSRSITNTTTRFALDREMEILRDMIYPHINLDFCPPPVEVAKGKIRLIRAMHRLSIWHPLEACKIALTVREPLSWWLALKWLPWKLRRLNDS